MSLDRRAVKDLKDLKDLHRGPDVIRKEAWPFYRTSSGVRLCWELEEPKGPKGRKEAWPFYRTISGIRLCWELEEPKGPKAIRNRERPPEPQWAESTAHKFE